MKNLKYNLFIGLLLILVIGCDEKTHIDSPYLSVRTNIDKMETRVGVQHKEEVWTGDKMGLFLFEDKEGNILYNEEDTHSNVEAYYDGSKWQITPEVILGPKKAYLYAYYPFQENLEDYSKIPFNLRYPVDYLYQAPEKVNTVNTQNSQGNIYLKHVFSSVTLLIKKTEDLFDGVSNPDARVIDLIVESTTGNDENSPMYSIGTFNAFTGEVTKTVNDNPYVMTNRVTLIGLREDYYFFYLTNDFPSLNDPKAAHFIVPPVLNPINAGDIRFVINLEINGDAKVTTLNLPLPNGTQWLPGVRYIYYVTVSNTDVSILDVFIEPWEIVY